MNSEQLELKPHSGQSAIAIFCICMALLYFVLAKATGMMNGWIAVSAALSAVPSILFLSRSRKQVFLRMARIFSFPVAIGILLIIYTWTKALNS